MRWLSLLVVAGCAPKSSPATTLRINATAVTELARPAIDAAIGSTIELHTSWIERCYPRTEDCDRVRHRVDIYCAEGCRIITADGESHGSALLTAPSTFGRTFRIEPGGETLSLEVTFIDGRDRRVQRLPRIRFVAADDGQRDPAR